MIALWYHGNSFDIGEKCNLMLSEGKLIVWLFSLPAEYDYCSAKMSYAWEMDAHSKRQEYARKYSGKIRRLMNEDPTSMDKAF